MSDKKIKRLAHRGRLAQFPIYLGKLLRSFVYQSDWKVLPMSAVIAALISMVIRKNFCLEMQGTLKGAFSLTCACIWNGCFNSIQSICRERDIVKREHRSGLHISSYVLSHMVYQALLCLAQTLITLYVLNIMGVTLPKEGLVTAISTADFGITLFLITFASDMLSLLVSALVHSSTAAMTVMPFLLIFQMIFSGGMFSLPGWAKDITPYTIGNPGMTAIASLADYNEQPMNLGWKTINHIQDDPIEGDVTFGQMMKLFVGMSEGASGEDPDLKELTDRLSDLAETEGFKDLSLHYDFTLRSIIDVFGQDHVKTGVDAVMAATSYKAAYVRSEDTVAEAWARMAVFAMLYALIAMIALEFIDKDKR